MYKIYNLSPKKNRPPIDFLHILIRKGTKKNSRRSEVVFQVNAHVRG